MNLSYRDKKSNYLNLQQFGGNDDKLEMGEVFDILQNEVVKYMKIGKGVGGISINEINEIMNNYYEHIENRIAVGDTVTKNELINNFAALLKKQNFHTPLPTTAKTTASTTTALTTTASTTTASTTSTTTAPTTTASTKKDCDVVILVGFAGGRDISTRYTIPPNIKGKNIYAIDPDYDNAIIVMDQNRQLYHFIKSDFDPFSNFWNEISDGTVSEIIMDWSVWKFIEIENHLPLFDIMTSKLCKGGVIWIEGIEGGFKYVLQNNPTDTKYLDEILTKYRNYAFFPQVPIIFRGDWGKNSSKKKYDDLVQDIKIRYKYKLNELGLVDEVSTNPPAPSKWRNDNVLCNYQKFTKIV